MSAASEEQVRYAVNMVGLLIMKLEEKGILKEQESDAIRDEAFERVKKGK